VFELLAMNLRDCFKVYGKNKGLSLDVVRSYGMQLFVSLSHLKKQKIVHADVKPDNILVSNDTKTVKLCDFGTAFPVEECSLVE
jgi:serine/threonine-protein kinase PRP4